MFDVANMISKMAVKDVPMNDSDLLNIYKSACAFLMFWEQGRVAPNL